MAVNAKGYPYPVGTDRVMDGDNAIQALADAVAAKMGRQVYSGVVLVNINAATSASVAVTFPVGMFATPPIVQVSINTATLSWVVTATTPATTGFTVNVFHNTGASGTSGVNVAWLAHLN